MLWDNRLALGDASGNSLTLPDNDGKQLSAPRMTLCLLPTEATFGSASMLAESPVRTMAAEAMFGSALILTESPVRTMDLLATGQQGLIEQWRPLVSSGNRSKERLNPFVVTRGN